MHFGRLLVSIWAPFGSFWLLCGLLLLPSLSSVVSRIAGGGGPLRLDGLARGVLAGLLSGLLLFSALLQQASLEVHPVPHQDCCCNYV